MIQAFDCIHVIFIKFSKSFRISYSWNWQPRDYLIISLYQGRCDPDITSFPLGAQCAISEKGKPKVKFPTTYTSSQIYLALVTMNKRFGHNGYYLLALF